MIGKNTGIAAQLPFLPPYTSQPRAEETMAKDGSTHA